MFDNSIDIIVFIQGLGDWLEPIMQFFTYLGKEEFYLIIMPALYWCLDTSLGYRVGMILMISASFNNYLKWFFHSPRPFWYSAKVHALSFDTYFGLPSGHAQNAVSVWGVIAAKLQRKLIWVIVVILIFLIGFSRVYLGVHFPIDILTGWLIGALFLWTYIKLEPRIKRWLVKQNSLQQAGYAFLLSIGLIILGFIIVAYFTGSDIPQVWSENAMRTAPKGERFNPWSLSGLIVSAAVLFGFSLGLVILNQRGGFDPGGIWWKRVLRFLLGIAGVLIIWAGLGSIFPDNNSFCSYFLRYLRYALVGTWISAGGPFIFLRLGLAKSKKK